MRRSTLPPALILLAGCGSDLINDPHLQRWCGDDLCRWEEQGEIARVSSWHSHDYALSFVSDDARLSQLNANATSTLGARCFEFTMVADVDPGVRIFLELDFLDDGVIDFSQRLPESDFEKLRFLITPPEWYSGVRFILRKDGPGRAVLAELTAQTSTACTAPPLKSIPRPNGADCRTHDDCADGRCSYGRCGGCGVDDNCGAGEVCGFEPVKLDYVQLCVDAGMDQFGDRCRSNAECASGICCNGACSECCTSAQCAGGAVCARPSDFPAAIDPDNPLYWPSLCAPGSRTRGPGALCASDDDCASLRCAGAELRGCELGCLTDTGGLCVVPCETTRVYGGTCE